jgi:hypothetical protein
VAVPSAAKKFAEEVEIRQPAPKGAIDFQGLAVSLKRYLDTKLSPSADCKAADENANVIAALKCVRENSSFAPTRLDHFPLAPTAYQLAENSDLGWRSASALR